MSSTTPPAYSGLLQFGLKRKKKLAMPLAPMSWTEREKERVLINNVSLHDYNNA